MNIMLITAGICSLLAAALHLGCIVFGAAWYRFMGAGEQMALWAEQGSLRPTVITSGIILVLTIWAIYAFSGASLIRRLPAVKLVLLLVTGIYLFRAVAGFFFIQNPIGRSPEFWLWSSLICLFVGVLHLLGTYKLYSAVPASLILSEPVK